MALNRAVLRLVLVTDPSLCRAFGLIETVRAAVAGGVTMVQLRDKGATTAQRVVLGHALMAELRGTGVPLIINDDVEAAIAIGADGLHIGQEDMPAAEARRLIGPDMILGLSCETVPVVQAADPACLDYIGVGPVFATQTKNNHKSPVGFAGLAELCAAASLPRVGIGGLKREHCASALAAGVDGIAVVSAICGQLDPEQAARNLRAELAALPS